MLIDSGVTHNFFHSRSAFLTYDHIAPETVRAAFSTSRILGKGTVLVLLNGGMEMNAYHTPHFTTNILSVSGLSEHFDILFSSCYKIQKGCFIFHKGTRNVVFETLCEKGLYIMKDITVGEATKHALAVQKESSELGWHGKTGHPSSDRYVRLSQMCESVPTFPRRDLDHIVCVPCLTAKARKAPILPVDNRTTAPLQEIHLDLSGPFIPTLTGETYAVHFIESHTVKSDVQLLKARSDLGPALIKYKAYVENHFAQEHYRIHTVRLDQARENVKGIVAKFCQQEGILLNPSPPYAPESNGSAEHVVQEHSTRTRVLMFASKLPDNLWGEAIKHANWLRNRLLARRIDFDLPILRWMPNTCIDFKTFLTFGQSGPVLSTDQRQLRVRSCYLVHNMETSWEVESDTGLMRMYTPHDKSIKIVRQVDFRTVQDDKLPSLSSLLDVLARQHSIEALSNDENGEAEAHLIHCMTSIHREAPLISWIPQHNTVVYDVPSSFVRACDIPEWAAAIDREFAALERRKTWRYVLRTPHMNVIKYKWVFRKKPLSVKGDRFLPKARCVARGDLQEAYVDFDPHSLYAPVATHESVILIFAYAAAKT